ncbi:Por secretion system C-terminal sorting domain-containing protein [Rhodothermus profundi]|uniref:Por secretion system C-terminal sorting domain-containing protein n=2 Tax=Rhodothermus profundi TaxID=633813 RepID=A0A1M6VCV8_9BACT|nr:Por secretion system C-terminal sorting domain-containing protein [Rhodothermus profundi]
MRYAWGFLFGGLLLTFGLTHFLKANEEVVVVLPIEVIGPDGYTVAVEVYVSDTTGVDSMYLKGHLLGYLYTPALEDTGGYDKKAAFRINGGRWIPIDNEHFKAFWPESQMFTPPLTGPIGGPYRTLRGMISIRGTGKLRPGRNTIEFRFNRTEGRTSGYRILELDLRRGGRNGQSVLQGTRFVWDDPAQWGPPEGYDTPEAIEEGRRLWQTRGILKGLAGERLVAACSDCHATDGRDLKYFNFSNQVIIQKAKLRGLTEEEGKKIAAYIRSVDLELPPGETVATCGGRPWNPPYQPGPGLSKRPVECWAAGAGIEWALARDRDVLAYLAPDAATEAALKSLQGVPPSPEHFTARADLSVENLVRHFNLKRSLPLTDIPVAYQMPDIFEWWPSVYPGDYFGAEVFHNSETYRSWEQAYEALKQPGQVAALLEEARRYANSWMSRGITTFFRFEVNTKAMPADLPTPPSWSDKSGEGELARLSLRQWILIKLWELVHKYKLEDKIVEIYGENARANEIDLSGWDRNWPVRGMWVYDMATHKQGSPYPDIGPYATKAQDQYFSAAWYQLSIILNNGTRTSGGTTNVDWNYVFAHINDMQRWYNIPLGAEYLKSLVAMMQTRTSWYVERKAPDWMVPGFGKQNRPGFKNLKEHMPLTWFYLGHKRRAQEFTAEEMRNITEALLRIWIEEAERYDERHAEWIRNWRDNKKHKILLPPDTTYDVRRESCSRPVPLDPNWYKDEAMLQFLYQAQCYGVDPVVLDRVARYMERISPGGNWERFFLEATDTQVQTLSLQAGWNLVSLYVQPERAQMKALLASIRDRLVLVKDEAGRVYSPELGVDQIKRWDWRRAYMVFVTEPTTWTVEGRPIPASATVTLKAGWNLIPYWSTVSMPVADALASLGSALVLVKDLEGRLFFPDYEVYTLQTLTPGQGYKVYVTKEVTLRYPAPPSGKRTAVVTDPEGSRATLSSVLILQGLPEEGQLQVRTEQGDIVGEGTVRQGRAAVVVWGDEPLTEAREGARIGETLELWWIGSTDTYRLPVKRVVDALQQQELPTTLQFAPDQVWVVEAEAIPRRFSLSPPYPHPVTNRSVLVYQLPEAARVRLEVFDVLGRRVATLVDAYQEAGTHRVVLDAHSLAGGTYFYRLQAGPHQATGQMIVIR